jgi:hypothetical protein
MAAITHREEPPPRRLHLVHAADDVPDDDEADARRRHPSRRRLPPAATAVLMVTVLALAVLVRGGLPSSAGGAGPAAGVHVVRPGESYWSIAAGLGAPGDVRAVVDRLVDDNGGRVLRPGDRLVLSP